jgi:hypothetical protein
LRGLRIVRPISKSIRIAASRQPTLRYPWDGELAEPRGDHLKIAIVNAADKIGIELFEFPKHVTPENNLEYWKTGIFHFCITDPDVEQLARKTVEPVANSACPSDIIIQGGNRTAWFTARIPGQHNRDLLALLRADLLRGRLPIKAGRRPQTGVSATVRFTEGIKSAVSGPRALLPSRVGEFLRFCLSLVMHARADAQVPFECCRQLMRLLFDNGGSSLVSEAAQGRNTTLSRSPPTGLGQSLDRFTSGCRATAVPRYSD